MKDPRVEKLINELASIMEEEAFSRFETLLETGKQLKKRGYDKKETWQRLVNGAYIIDKAYPSDDAHYSEFLAACAIVRVMELEELVSDYKDRLNSLQDELKDNIKSQSE